MPVRFFTVAEYLVYAGCHSKKASCKKRARTPRLLIIIKLVSTRINSCVLLQRKTLEIQGFLDEAINAV